MMSNETNERESRVPFLRIDVCVYGGPQYFDVLDGERIESKIIHKVLKVWVILQKSPEALGHSTGVCLHTWKSWTRARSLRK